MMNTNVLTAIRTAKGFSRTVSYLIIVAVVGIVLERTIYYSLRKADVIDAENVIEKLYRIAPHKARQLGLPKQVSHQPKEKTNDTKLSEAVVETQDTLDVLAYELHRDSGDPSKAQDKLDKLYAQLQGQDQLAMADFRKIGRHIEQHQLPDVIKERHNKAVITYRKEMDSFLDMLKTATVAQNPKEKLDAVMAARQHLEGKQLKRSHQPFDPNDLPFKSEQPAKDNKPKRTQADFARAGLFNSPQTQYAALGDFTYGNLAGASNPAYQAETVEVKITEAIRAQAAALNHDPVQIYHWIRSNIQWSPSWGAMQDADITLGSQRGNAMDISTLLIALLRASQIPARYVHGTINVSADKIQNWAGGFSDIGAALDFISAGGIPAVGVVSAGQIQRVEMEHIWVEVAIDYLPSRGAVNRDADSWISMDASFKQFEYLSGLDAAAITGLDGAALTDSFVATGTINETEGWVSGLDPSVLQAAQTETQTALEDYITTNLPDATVGDVIGGRKIITHQASSLPSSLPNQVLVTGARYSELPASLQYKGTYVLGRDILNQPIAEITLPWAQLNNHKLTLSFKPATPDDETALQSYLPEGEITDISQLPSSLPAYLINVLPELKLDGQVVATGEAMGLGTELDFSVRLERPGKTSLGAISKVIAGSFVSVVTVGGSVSGTRLQELQTRITAIKTALESGDLAQIGNLTREDLLGDMFYAGTLGYFAQYMSLAYIAGIKYGVAKETLPSTGTYGYVPKVNYFFSIPASIGTGGIEMDLGMLSSFGEALDDDVQKRFNYIMQVGTIASALEHTVPEQMFITPDNPGEAVSAVKLLSKANAAGQRIYHITQSNSASVLPSLNLNPGVMTEITYSLNAGKEVITHTDNLTVNGWTGSGYIIFDPETGDGSYKIGGGLNGGLLAGIIAAILMTTLALITAFALISSGLLWSIIGGIILLVWELINIYQWLSGIHSAKTYAQFNQANFGQVILSFTAALPISALIRFFGVSFGWMILQVT